MEALEPRLPLASDPMFLNAKSFPLGGDGVGIFAGDFNNDGKLDIAATKGSQSQLGVRLGDGSGGFGSQTDYPIGSSPYSVSGGDFNNDGFMDLVTANYSSNTASVLLNLGNGEFAAASSVPTGSGPHAVTVGDFNRDGNVDFATANWNASSITVRIGNGSGDFSPAGTFPVGSTPRGITQGDFNGDGLLDLATANAVSNSVSVLFGESSGSFSRAVSFASNGASTYAIAAADANGDGRTDLFTSNFRSSSLSVFIATGNNSFEPAQLIEVVGGFGGITASDLNFDGYVDLVAADFNGNRVAVVPGLGNGTFGQVTFKSVGTNPQSITTGDFDRDGRIDVVTANQGSNSISLLLNSTSVVSFSGPTVIPGSAGAYYLASADFNRDGNRDLSAALYNRNGVNVFTGSANGTLSAPTFVAGSSGAPAVISGDFDGDSKPDLVSASIDLNQLAVLRGRGDGAFDSATFFAAPQGPVSLIGGDFDEDGKLDVVTANVNGGTISFFKGNGDTTFANAIQFPSGLNPWGIATGDLNVDGHIDIVVSNTTPVNTVSILLGTGTGGFSLPIKMDVGSQPRLISIADFNRDGNDDIAVANEFSNSVSVIINDKNLGYLPAVQYAASSPFGITSADLNLDGYPEIVTSSEGTGTITILTNRGDGTFLQTNPISTGGAQSRYVLANDFNNDTLLDLAIANYGSGSISLFLNTSILSSAMLDLADASDSGVSSVDNITNDTTPTFRVTVNKPGQIELDFSGDGVVDASLTATTPGEYSLTSASPLTDGQRNVAAYFTPTGGARFEASRLSVTIDTAGPRVISYAVTATSSIKFSFDSAIDINSVSIIDLDVTGPQGGIDLLSFFADSTTAQFDFLNQSAIGTYTYTLGPGLQDLAGNSMNQDADLINGETTEDQYIATSQILPKTDLVVSSISSAASVTAGQLIPVTWTVTNQGAIVANGPWRDEVLLSSDEVLGSDIPLGQFLFEGTLLPGESITRTQNVTIPRGISGSHRLVVMADATGLVPESTESNNATIDDATINVTVPLVPNLIVTSIQQPTTAFSDQLVSIDWVVTNSGTSATNTLGWIDRVFLSLDSVLDGNDTLLGQMANGSYLNPSDSYKTTFTGKLPRGIDGNYRFIVVTDANNSVIETGFESDNSLVSSVMTVTLTPPPDLRVASITAPANAFSGQTIQVGWSVTNGGTGPTIQSSWQDRVFLSFGDNQLDSNDVLLATRSHVGELLPGGNYSAENVDVELPIGVSGEAFFIVQTDVGNQVFEHVFESNNLLSTTNATNVLLTPPPDLTVTSFNVPASAIAGQPFVVTYTITNEGSTATPNSSWSDTIYLSSDTNLDTAADLLLGVRVRNGVLEATQSETKAYTFTLPNTLSGTFYVIVNTDSTNTVFEIDNANNVVASTTTTGIEINPPDLIVSSISTTDVPKSGRTFSLSYSVTNQGASPTPITSWNDAFFLSTDATRDSNDVLLYQQLRTGIIEASQDDLRTANFQLPVDRIGSFFILAVSDSTDSVFELNNANNLRALPITIQDDRPDLAIRSFTPRTGNGSVSFGSTLAFDYEVENRGVGATFGSTWNDALILSSDSTVGNADDLVLGTYVSPSTLSAGSSYVRSSLNITIPISVVPGSYQLFLQTDTGNSVSERDETNNGSSFVPLTITIPGTGGGNPDNGITVSDLQVSSLVVPASVASGTDATISWTVTNAGVGKTNSTSWIDRAWLSRDDLLSSDDISLGFFTRAESLAPGQSYTRTINSPIGIDLSGSFRILVETDANQGVYEGTNETNNVRAAESETTIVLSPTADLQIASLTAPAEVFSGRATNLSWVGMNSGIGNAAGTWFDSVYLSLDQIFDQRTDISLGYLARTNGLNAGEQYTASGAFNIPSAIGGQYYVLVVVDSTNIVYERNTESNNVYVLPNAITVSHIPPADLVVGSITIPANGAPGQNATIEFTVTNNGQNPAIGSWSDAIYISADDVWDIDDGFFGRVTHSGEVLAGGTYTSILTAPLPGVLPGNYKVIVRSDIRNNLVESNENNNLAASLNRFEIDVPALELGVPSSGLIAQNQSIYYKFTVEANQTVVIEFDSALANGYTELYASFNVAPQRSNPDFSGIAPLQVDQRIVISSTKAGTYYVHAFGTDIPTISSPYSIIARVIPFTVFDTSFGMGGSSGDRTIAIHGAKFDRTVTATLVGNDGIEFEAIRYTRINEQLLFATFDLRGKQLQQYDVRIAKPSTSESILVSNGFLIVKSSGKLRNPTVTAPTFYDDRSTAPIPVIVGWYNDTLNDELAPLVTISSTSPFAESREDALNGKTTISRTYFGYNSSDETPGVLIPGETATVTIYIQPAGGQLIYPSAAFVYERMDDPFDWVDILSHLSIVDKSATSNSAIVNAFVAQQGFTIGGFRRSLAEGLRLLGRMPSIRYDEAEPLIFQRAFEHFAATQSDSLFGDIQYSSFDVDFTRMKVDATSIATGLKYFADVTAIGTFAIPFLDPGDYLVRVFGGAKTTENMVANVRNTRGTQVHIPVVPAISLEGTITDSETGLALDNARVTITSTGSGSEQFETLTDSFGRFAFEDASSGTYSLHATRSGYANVTNLVQVSQSSLRETVVVAMPKGASVFGIIRTTDGKMPTNSIVIAVGKTDMASIAVSVKDDGTYDLGGLGIGLWTLQVLSKQYVSQSPIELEVVRPERYRYDLDLVSGGAITGLVHWGGNPISDAIIEIIDSSGMTRSTTSNSTGDYAIEGISTNSPLKMTVQAVGFALFGATVLPLRIDELRHLDIAIDRGRIVSGQVRTSGGLPVPLAKLEIYESSTGSLKSVTASFDGTFLIDALLPGMYELVVSSGEFATSKSLVDLSSGDQSNFSVVMYPYATLGGSVRRQDGSIITQGMVLLMRHDDGLSFVSSVSSLGEYSFASFPEGSYTIWYVSSDRFSTSHAYHRDIGAGTENELDIETAILGGLPSFTPAGNLDPTIYEIEQKVQFASVETENEEPKFEELSVQAGLLRDRLTRLNSWVKVDVSDRMPDIPSLMSACNINFDLLQSLQSQIREYSDNASNAYAFGLQDQKAEQAQNYSLYLTNRSKFELLFANASTKLKYVRPLVDNLIRIVETAKFLGGPETPWSKIDSVIAAPASRILFWLDLIDAGLNFLGITAPNMNAAISNMEKALNGIQQSQEKRDQLSRDYINAISTVKGMVVRFNSLKESGEFSAGLNAPSAARSGKIGEMIQGNILAPIASRLTGSGIVYSTVLISGSPNILLLPNGHYSFYSFKPINVSFKYQLKIACSPADDDGLYGTISFSIESEPIRPQPRSVDPNDIVGPSGYGDGKWIAGAQLINYAIRFENDALLAQAPAQVVRIVQSLDEDLDPRSFRLGSFGFGGQVFDVPENRSFISTRLDVREVHGVFVDVIANVNVASREIVWLFTAIDPATGEIPDNPLIGFLPPNVSAPEGDGFVSYTVRPRASATNGSRIDAQARIFFDDNAPIDTPPIFNTLDTSSPTSTIVASSATANDPRLRVRWQGGDGDVGSGVASYDIFVSENDGPYVLWLDDTDLTESEYPGVAGRRYSFYGLAKDRVGNQEAAPPAALLAFSTTNRVITEGNSSRTAFSFTVMRSGDLSSTTTVRYAVAGSDGASANAADFGGTFPSGTVTFAPNETSKIITINVIGDTLVEPNESFIINLLSPTVGSSISVKSATGVIQNDDIDTGNQPVIGGFDGTVTYIEGAVPMLLDSNATVVDPDSLNMAGGKLTVAITINSQLSDRLGIKHLGDLPGQIGISGFTVNYGGVSIGTFTGTTTLVVSLNENATPKAVQSLLRSVTFVHLSENPSVLERTVRVTLTDGDGETSNSPTKIVQVLARNDAPVLGAFDTTVTYTENAIPLLLDTNATVLDIDSADLAGGKLLVSVTLNRQSSDRIGIAHLGNLTGQIGVNGTEVSYGGVVIGTFAGTSSLVVTLNELATPLAVQALLRRMTFYSLSENSSILDRTVRVTLTDGDGGTSNAVTKIVKVVARNDAPILGGFDTAVTYVEGSVSTRVDSNATVVDPDSFNVDGGRLTVTISANAQPTDRLGIKHIGSLPGQIGVSGTTVSYGELAIGTFSGTTSLVVTLNENASPRAVQALLRSVIFFSVSENPAVVDRTIRVTLTDGDGGTSNAPTKIVQVQRRNDAPVLGAFDTTVTYAENAVPVILDSNATVLDVDSTDMSGGKLIITVSVNRQSTDRIGIKHVGNLSGQIGVDGMTVSYGGVAIGTFAGTSSLTITLNENATPLVVQALLRSVTFFSVSENPSTLDRTIQVILKDGDGGTSNSVTKTVRVTARNDAPVINGFDEAVTYVVGAVPLRIDSNATIFDPDSLNLSGGSLTIAVTGDAQATDRLGIQHSGILPGQIGVSGSTVSYGGVEIGTFSGTTSLVILLNENATPLAVQALLRNVTFSNLSANPSKIDRTVKVTLTDGDGGTSNTPTKLIRLK